MMKRRYAPNHWGGLRQFQAPVSMFTDNQLNLGPNALTVYLLLVRKLRFRTRKNEQPLATIQLGLRRMIEKTGYSKNRVSAAVRELVEKKYLFSSPARKKHGHFGVPELVVRDPRTGDPLMNGGGKNVFRANGVPYINIPVCVVDQSDAHWSLAKLTGKELSLFIALCHLANWERKNQFEIDSAHVRKLARLSRPTFLNAFEAIQEKGLVYAPDSHTVELCDPYTGEPICWSTPEDDPANYFSQDSKSRDVRIWLNWEDPEIAEELIRSCLDPNTPVTKLQQNGDLMIPCVFHSDTNPSLSISPSKRCFLCFGCKRKGNLTELIMHLLGTSKGEAIKLMAQSAGQKAVFRDPDKNYWIYPYEDEKGKLLKQVLRSKNENEKEKKLLQRRPAPGGGYIWNTDGVRPVLYNLPRLQFARIAILVEGEKDADRVNKLGLKDPWGRDIIATTSGGSGTWRDELADLLQDKQVIILPDADKPGREYAQEIAESLRKRNIELHLVQFNEEGVNDVSDYLDRYSPGELIDKIGKSWFQVVEPEPVVEA